MTTWTLATTTLNLTLTATNIWTIRRCRHHATRARTAADQAATLVNRHTA